MMQIKDLDYTNLELHMTIKEINLVFLQMAQIRLFITGNAATNGRVGVNTIGPNAPLDVFHNGSATYKDMIMARKS